jgi:uncharacterized membrane protein YfcA
VDLTILLLAGLSVVAGAVAQGTVGLGLGLIAAPVVALLDPTLMPGSALLLGFTMPLITLAQEWRHIAWPKAGWLIGSRLATTPLGLLVLAWVPASAIGVLVGAGVLVSVILAQWRIEARPTTRNLVVAGAVGGVSGTAASVAGPPAAILLRHEPGPQLRATLAAFFACGSAGSLVALDLAGRLSMRQIGYGLSWIPALVLGFTVAIPLRRRLQGNRLRTAVLVISALSAIAAIVRGLL